MITSTTCSGTRTCSRLYHEIDITCAHVRRMCGALTAYVSLTPQHACPHSIREHTLTVHHSAAERQRTGLVRHRSALPQQTRAHSAAALFAAHFRTLAHLPSHPHVSPLTQVLNVHSQKLPPSTLIKMLFNGQACLKYKG